MSTHKIDDHKCPACGKQLGAVTHIEGKTTLPKQGDPSICLHCGAVLALGSDLCGHEPTAQDYLNWIASGIMGKIARAQRVIVEANCERN